MSLTPEHLPDSQASTMRCSRLLQSLPAPALHSALMKKGGFDIFEGMVDDRGRRLMLDEALRLLPTGIRSEVQVSDNEELRGGSPARCFLSAQGGQLQDDFYNAGWLLDFLRSICGVSVVPTGHRGTFSYYIQPGDHLSIHRDILTCNVAVITCLLDTADTRCDSGKTCLYPGRISEPLSALRATPDCGAVKARLLAGQTMVMFGGILPHAILPTEPGQKRIVSVLCYRV